MITNELLNANEVLNALTDEQKAAVCTLSKNDEEQVIGTRIGEIYGNLDNDILAASGMTKNGTEKTYAYAKRVIGEIKAKAESASELAKQVEALTSEKARIEKLVAEGGNAEAQKQLAQAKTDLADITKKYTELADAMEQAKAEHARELFSLRVAGELENATKGIKMKQSLPDAVRNVVLNQVLSELKAVADYEDMDGKQTLVFKGANGEILRNQSAGLAPFTASELISRKLDEMGVLEKGRTQGGAGSKAGSIGNADGIIDVSSAKTQVEAENLIHDYLTKQGLTRGSKEYESKKSEIWKGNDIIRKLPIK